MQYFVTKTREAMLPSGERIVLVRGLRALPEELVNHLSANGYGVKPISEMNPAERTEFGLPPLPASGVLQPQDPAPESPAPAAPSAAPTLATQAPRPPATPAAAPAEASDKPA